MGEKFKVIGLSRNFSQELNGFAMMNLLHFTIKIQTTLT